MKWRLMLVLLVVVLLATELVEGKRRKHKKRDRQNKKRPRKEKVEEPAEPVIEKDRDEIDMMVEDEVAETEESNEIPTKLDEIQEDPCGDLHCTTGRECIINHEGQGMCDCVTECSLEVDPRRQVCSNHNETWASDCELYRMRCLCVEGRDGCLKEKFEHVHVEYYGECREMPECVTAELEDFPRRMRDWLFNIMRDMAERKELSEYYLQLEREAEENQDKRWINGVIWKWCDLDAHPKDKEVSRHELFPIRAPLMSLEHCIAPFLDGCDADKDHKITLQEWAGCLGLDQEEIEDKCEEIEEMRE